MHILERYNRLMQRRFYLVYELECGEAALERKHNVREQ